MLENIIFYNTIKYKLLEYSSLNFIKNTVIIV